MLLRKIPIVLYYGDNRRRPSFEPGRDQWRAFVGLPRLWRDALNRRGGDVTPPP